MAANESTKSSTNNNPSGERPTPPPPPPSSDANSAGLRHRRAPSSMPTNSSSNSNTNNAPPPAAEENGVVFSPLATVPASAAAATSSNTTGSTGQPPRHNRKVSWGGVTSPTLNATPSVGVASALASIIPQQQQQQSQPQSPLVGDLPSSTHTNASATSNISNTSNATSSFLESLQKVQGPSTRRFNLNEMLGSGPVELEAETHILRAVEKISGQRHDRTTTEMGDLFREIAADDIARSMQQQQKAAEEDSDNEEDDDLFDSDVPPPQSSYLLGDNVDDGSGGGLNGCVPQVGSQDAIEVTAAPSATRSMESFPSFGSTGTSHTQNSVKSTSAIGGQNQQQQTPIKSPGKSTPSLGANVNTGTSTRSLGATGKSSRFLGLKGGGMKSKLQSAVRKQMVANTVENTLLNLTSTLNTMKDEEERKKEHRRQLTQQQMNMAENDRLTETVQALTGHLGGNNTSNHSHTINSNSTHSTHIPSDVEAPSNTSKTGDSNPPAMMMMGDTDDSSDDDSHNRLMNSGQDTNNSKKTNDSKKKRKKKKMKGHALSSSIKEDFQLLQEFITNQKWKMQVYLYRVITFIMFPSLAIAALLFYFVENPALCEEEVQVDSSSETNGTTEMQVDLTTFVCPGTGASVSWWILFLGVRQVVTFTMALFTQAFVVDYLALGSRFCLRYFGPLITLFLVQSKGWPFVAVFWAIYDLVLLYGNHEYTHHWAYWQDYVELFNASNPSGTVVEHEMNYLVLRLTIIVGIIVAFKRLFVSLFLGRQTFAHFGEQLAAVMKNMVLVGEVATLAKDIEYYTEQDLDNTSVYQDGSSVPGEWGTDNDIQQLVSKEVDAERQAQALQDSQVASNAATAAKTFMASRGTPAKLASNSAPSFRSPTPSVGGASAANNEDFTKSEQRKLSELLDAWEEPETAEQKEEKKISIGAVLQFRQALTFMQRKHPFLPAFGPADTRDRCVESAQQVYERMLLRTPERQELPFETIALLSKDDFGRISQEKAKQLIRAFRPDREGTISKLDFVKSIDAIYKSIRLLSANVRNSSQIDKAVESLVNVIFYIILGSFVLGQLGVNPLQLFFSLSSVILAFAFMFGNSSSKYFEGMLFILVQRPYGVGDRIHLSNPSCETNIDGSSGWIVEKVSLYTTSLYWGATNERATIANGSVSNLRVINSNRSPHAQLFVNMKFATDTPFEKIVIFKAAVEQFLKDRPREWLAFVGFRPTEVSAQLNYINYVTIAQHRSGWQDIGQVLTSKAELVTYEMEVAKQLQMTYSSPPLPVDLTMKGGGSGGGGEMTPDALKNMEGWSS